MALENITITACANSTPPAGTCVGVFKTSASVALQGVVPVDTSGNLTGAAAASPMFVSVANSPSVIINSGSVVVTNGLSASISNIASVIVSSGSVVVTNPLSASISNSPSVIVSSGSVTVINQVSASVSNVASVIVSSGSVTVINSVSASISNSPSMIVSSGSVVVTNGLSASISNVASVVISSGSVVVTNPVSASISNTVNVAQSTAAAITAPWPVKISDGTDSVAVNSASQLTVAITAASVQIVDGSGNQYGISAASPLYITGGAAGGTSSNDLATFAEGTTSFTPAGGVYLETTASLTASQMGLARMTASRAIHVNLRNASGLQLGVSAASPLFTSSSAVVTNIVSASISNVASVIVSSGSVTVINPVSASISNVASVIVSSGSVVVTNQVSASISNVASVIVSSGSAVVTNALSASVSNFPTLADKATFAEGTTVATPIQGLMLNTTACLTASQVGAVRINEWRAQHVTIRTASGNELGAGSGSPFFVSVGNALSASISNVASVIISSGSVVVTNPVSASISNVASVIVSSGSVVVTNALSASISNVASVIVSSGSVVVTNPISASISNVITTTGSGIDVDKATFAEGTTTFTTMGGMFLDTTVSLTASQIGITRQTANRAVHVNIRDANGSQLGAGGASPLFVSVGNGVSASISNVASVIVSSGSVVVTNPLSASISNVASVIVSSGSVVVTNALSASISNSLSAIQSTGACPAGAWPIRITDLTNVYGVSGSPLSVAAELGKIYFAGSLVSTSTINISGSVSGCTRIVASTAGQAIVVLAVTYTTSSCQNIGWVASGAGAASALVQTPMPFGTFGGQDVNRMPYGWVWAFPAGSNAVMTTTSACIVGGNMTYISVASA